MKYGVHNYVFYRHWNDAPDNFLHRLRELGLDCVEIAVGNDVEIDPKKLRRQAEEADFDILLSPGAEWPMNCDLSSENPTDRQRGQKFHRKFVDLAAEVGAKAYCGALYGHPGHVECRRPDSDEFKRAADEIRSLAQYADEQDVKIALEPMSHFRTHLINTPAQLKDFLELVGHENAFGLLDTYHLVTELRDYESGFRLLGDKLFGVHACENDRGYPRPDGLIPWDSVFRALKAIHFDGYVMMESYNSSIEDFAFERGMFHNVCPDGETFVREGLGYLRQELTGAELAIGD